MSDPVQTAGLQTSPAAENLIIAEEDSDQAYYTRHYQHFEWPAGASGPTVGIGFDCGYSTPQQIHKAWDAIIDPDMVVMLCHAAGLKGDAAYQFVRTYGNSVTITWDQAIREFHTRELPNWEAQVRNALPNTDQLHGDSFGALVSLAYNRGAGGFHMTDDRHREMRAIAQHMADKVFDRIPGEFLAMRRLWPQGGDLWRRRTHEAALFQQGLDKMKASQANNDFATPGQTIPQSA